MLGRLFRQGAGLKLAASQGARLKLASAGLGGAVLAGGTALTATSCAPACATATAEEDATTKKPSLMQKCLAEAIGTGLIVQGGCGVVCAAKYAGSTIGAGAMAAVWGASVALAAYATANISGAHLNPAVVRVATITPPHAVQLRSARVRASRSDRIAAASLLGRRRR